MAFFFLRLIFLLSQLAVAISLPYYCTIDIVNVYPHDAHAFTEGVVYGGEDVIFESTGNNDSSIRQVSLESGKVETILHMDASLFGEGLTLLGERLFQLTLENNGFIYNRYNFNNMTTFINPMKAGWGLTTDGNAIIGSDGSSTLYHLDPHTLKVVKRVNVTYHGQEVPCINELEYIDGQVFANIFLTECIAIISPEDGQVISWVFLHQLRKDLVRSGYRKRDLDVLNGIAWDNEKRRLFVTGKYWPKLYEIKLRPLTTLPKESLEKLCRFNLCRQGL